jgi:mRNA interferase RelE/StbE
VKLDPSARATKYLLTLDAKLFRQVMRSILLLASDPFPQGSKALAGYDRLYRIRCGDYRVVYRVVGDTVVILLVGPRADVYRQLRDIEG